MKVSAIQMNMIFEEPEQNYLQAEQLVEEASKGDCDVIVLPETWNTGFFPKDNLEKYCDQNGQKTKALFSRLAKKYHKHIIAGSVSDFRDGKCFNSSYIFDREGNVIANYDKTHLFSYMDEDKYYEKGGHICTFNLDNVKCGIVICYDLRFLELVRTLALDGIEVLFIVAQWPRVRLEHWMTLCKARAIENQIYVVAVNSCGVAGETQYGGHSLMIDPWGNLICEGGDEACTIEGILNIETIQEIRNTIHVFKDRRTELYQLG
ncbi:carbon-nitrogen family hydrolase [Fusibacter paucivorans]|uniref:Carbon-nitrogen family hydrolase n=1 Tax=Fusibacter paucivorans TaxID=76009 RepID=A0ABS5PJW2_9FIRM|nr:carbon-nitrogen family hydrolase [Fusibacter paucivorans]MBS7525281.1 carbon-nitrogen family hydrolase [Fusibacter paucivorans]